MAESPLSPTSKRRMFLTVPVNVIGVDKLGNIKFEQNALQRMPLPEYVNLPLPNSEAHKLVNSTLSGKTFNWLPIEKETMEYNIFRDAAGTNVTHALYKEIVGMLGKAIGLPEVHKTGRCRISPVCESKQLYVQPQPEYVDTISYAICMAYEERKLNETFKPAEDVVIGEIYILATGYCNYRVKIEKRISSPDSSSSKELGESRVSPERDTTISTRCGLVGKHENGRVGKDSVCGNGGDDLNGRSKDTSCGSGEQSEEDPDWELLKITEEESEWELLKKSYLDSFHGVNSEKFQVFRIDYGGKTIRAHRADLYDVESVCPGLKTLGKLAIPVTVGEINKSTENKDAQIKDLRKQQKIIKVETLFRSSGDDRVLVDLFH